MTTSHTVNTTTKNHKDDDNEPISKHVACREHPLSCLREMVLDGAVIVIAYALLAYTIEGKSVDGCRAVLFLSLYVGLSFGLRYMNLEFGEQLSRVVGFQLGNKLFTCLAASA